MTDSKTININVPVLARVEGEGALDLTIKDQQITDLKLRIYEPPRYFEKFLEGRNYYDVPDTVARICGICPVAYQMSASHAIESIFDVTPSPWIRSMRRLFYCGEWIQSHSLHIHLLAAPDFLGFNSVIDMSSQFGDEVRRGFKLQTLGNDLVTLMGARSVHPVGVKIGGFTKAPDQKSVDNLLQRVSNARQDAIDLIHWLDTLDLADDEQDFVSVALHHSDEYPFNEGRIISDAGLDIQISEFENHFKETHRDHSTALHCSLNGKPYLVGPLARINLNARQFPDEVKNIMRELKAQFPSKNMFHSIIARAIEIYFCILEAESILTDYQPVNDPFMKVQPKAGTGFGCTEAPRGILWHRYDMDEQGCVSKANIIPPTSQNQSRIEEDLKTALIHFGLDKPKQDLQLHAEKVIRNYDPCISCATHFLNLNLVRNGQKENNTLETAFFPRFKNIKINKTVIIGIGSPQEKDEAGWQAIDVLKHNHHFIKLQNRGLTLIKLNRPGIMLTDSLRGFDHAVLIDATKPDISNTSLKWVDIHKIKSRGSLLSSHEIGITEALEWINSIESLPKDIALLGVSNFEPSQLTDIILSCIENKPKQ